MCKVIVKINVLVYIEKAIAMVWSCCVYVLGQIAKKNANVLGQIEKTPGAIQNLHMEDRLKNF